MQLAVCNDVYQGWAWEDVCRDAAGAGYAALELAPATLGCPADAVSKEQVKELRATADRYGLRIAGMHWLMAGVPGLHLYDPAARAVTEPYLAALTRLCAELGGEVLVLGSPAQRRIPAGMSPATAHSLAVAVLRQWGAMCADAGVTICLEPLTAQETDFMISAQSAVELIEEAGGKGLALHLDVRAMQAEDAPPEQVIRRYSKYLRHVHVNDAGMVAPGRGPANYDLIMAALGEVGYQGYLSLEVFDLEGRAPDTVVRESAEFLRRFPGVH